MGVAVGWVTHFLDGTALLAHVASSGGCNYYSPACIELCLMIKSLCIIAETVYRYVATLQYLVLQYRAIHLVPSTNILRVNYYCTISYTVVS